MTQLKPGDAGALKTAQDFLNGGGGSKVVLLENTSGHVFVCAEAVLPRGPQCLQVLHGAVPPVLVPVDEAHEFVGDIVAARAVARAPLRIPPNDASPLVLTTWHSFGCSKVPHQRADITVINDSDRICYLGQPSTTCGCITASIATQELAPKRSGMLTVELQATPEESYFQTVRCDLLDKPGGVPIGAIVCHVFGAPFPSPKAVPSKVDFGPVLPGQTVARSVSIRRPALSDEPLVIESVRVEPSDLPIEVVDASESTGDRAKIHFRATGPLTEADFGEHAGEAFIDLRGEHEPLRVAIRILARPPARATPQLLEFAESGEAPRTATARIIARNGGPLTVKVVDAPSAVRVSLEPQADDCEVSVMASLSVSGTLAHQDCVKLEVFVGEVRQIVVLPCRMRSR